MPPGRPDARDGNETPPLEQEAAPATADPTGPGPLATPLALRANFSWTFFGNVAYAASQWGIVVLLAKLGTPRIVGRYSLALALTTPVMTFALLSLREVFVTDTRRDYAFREYVWVRVAACGAAFLLLALVVPQVYVRGTALVVLAVAISKVFDGISDIYWGLFQQRERMDVVARSLIARNLASVVVLAAAVFLTGSLLVGALLSAAVSAATLVAYDLPRSRGLAPRDARDAGSPPGPRRLRLLGLSLPLAVSTTLISLNVTIPRIFVESHAGEAQLGIFASIAYLMVPGITLMTSLGQAVAPRLARTYADGDSAGFWRLVGKMTALACGLGVAGLALALIAGERVLTLLYSPAYGEHSDVFVWVMIAALVQYVAVVVGFTTTATRQFRRFLLPYVAVTVVAVAASAQLIPVSGIRGAAWVLCITAAASCLIPLAFLTYRHRAA